MAYIAPCPYCKSENVKTETFTLEGETKYAGTCIDCGTRGPIHTGTRNEARKKWNRIPRDETKPATTTAQTWFEKQEPDTQIYILTMAMGYAENRLGLPTLGTMQYFTNQDIRALHDLVADYLFGF